jgi:pimeloyl-ACP methyl ester carboxylesterase
MSVDYDEFGMFRENAAEFDLPYDVAPAVRRTSIDVESGRRLSALLWGDGPPELVLLHGGGQNAHTWDTVALALRPRPLIAIDLPGHGHSDPSRAAPASLASPTAAARDVAAMVRALAPTASGIVGMSLGGLTTIALTEVAPELVRKVMLVDVLPGLEIERARHIRDFMQGPVTFSSFDEILERTIRFNPTRSASSLRRGILHNAIQLDDDRWVWRHAVWRLDAPSAPRVDPSAGGTVHDDLIETLRRVQVPLLLARGMRPDSILRDSDEDAFRAQMPEAEVVRFDQAGHSIQGDSPLELAAVISRFLP